MKRLALTGVCVALACVISGPVHAQTSPGTIVTPMTAPAVEQMKSDAINRQTQDSVRQSSGDKAKADAPASAPTDPTARTRPPAVPAPQK